MSQLREWQKRCLDSIIQKHINTQTFLCVACPGAGKSYLSAKLAELYLRKGIVDYIVCIAPSCEIVSGLRSTFKEVLGSGFDAKLGAVGGVYTYQSLKGLGKEFWEHLAKYKVLVIIDEIHHCSGHTIAEANAWGTELFKNIEKVGTFILAMTGTPWRSDDVKIPLLEYDPDTNALICDFEYSLTQAVEDGVCRSPRIYALDNPRIAAVIDGARSEYSSVEELTRLGEVGLGRLINDSKVVLALLEESVNRLDIIRRSYPSAGGLVVADSIKHAEQILTMLERHFGKSATIVTSKNKDAQDRIAKFRYSDEQWIVAVGMISEGVDIPRLQVCCHLTSVKTELHFRQVLGRVLRWMSDGGNEGWLYILAHPALVACAEEIYSLVPEARVNTHLSTAGLLTEELTAHAYTGNGDSESFPGCEDHSIVVEWLEDDSKVIAESFSQTQDTNFQINFLESFRAQLIQSCLDSSRRLY
jgi:superfamily II DNA or RNA helicase|tara:strand:- start:462 stop:1877 length:1416 start_codon:yes stop_codon:yes gene_type:complete